MPFATQASHSPERHESVGAQHAIAVGDGVIESTLTVPDGALGLVVLLHAASAGRFDPRNIFVGQVLEQSGLATLQVDLLTPGEEAKLARGRDRSLLLLTRALGVLDWLRNQPSTSKLALGLFASSEETVVALNAAEFARDVAAVVSQADCPDSDATLTQQRVPTLLIVGEKEQARAPELAAEFFARHLRRRR